MSEASRRDLLDRPSWQKRAVIAFVIAPVSLGIAALPFPAGAWAFMFSAAVGYPLALFIGLPLFLVSRARDWTGFWVYILFALVLAAIISAIFVVIPAMAQHESVQTVFSSQARWAQMFVAAIISILSVSVFWLIARPDRE